MRTIVVLTLFVAGCATTPTNSPSDLSAPFSSRESAASTKLVSAGLPVSDSRSHAVNLSVVSYNAHLLPDIAYRFAGKRGNAEYRSSEIGKHLGSFDIVGICEAFEPKYRDTLVEQLQRNSLETMHVLHGPQRSGKHLINGGLLLATRFPIQQSNWLTFSASSRYLTHGLSADAFATKGVLHARLSVLPGESGMVDCFLTHLESQSSKARGRQVQELSAFIQTHASPERPIVLLGDLNVVADVEGSETSSEYAALTEVLDGSGRSFEDVAVAHGVAEGTSDATADSGGQRIDYIFLGAASPQSSIRMASQSARVLPFRDQNVAEGSLSDHAAVACEIRLSVVESAR